MDHPESKTHSFIGKIWLEEPRLADFRGAGISGMFPTASLTTEKLAEIKRLSPLI